MVDWCFEPRMALEISCCYLLDFDAVPVCSTGSCANRLSFLSLSYAFVWSLSCLISLADISVHLPCPMCSAFQSSCSTL